MDQALYDQLKEARDTGVLKGTDLTDFNTLEAGGEFRQFQGAQPGAAPGAPNVMTPAQAETPAAAAPGALPKIGDTVDFTNRPPTDLAPDPKQPFATEFSNRAGLPNLSPGDPSAGSLMEPLRRLQSYPQDPALGPFEQNMRAGGEALRFGAQAPWALGGTLAHELTGSQGLGSAVQYGLPSLLVARALQPYLRAARLLQTARQFLSRPPGPPAPGPGGPGTPPMPGAPAGGTPPPGAAAPPTVFTSYPPGGPRILH